MNEEKYYNILDIMEYGYGIMNNIHVQEGREDYYSLQWEQVSKSLNKFLTGEEKAINSSQTTYFYLEKSNTFSDEVYARFLKECDIYNSL